MYCLCAACASSGEENPAFCASQSIVSPRPGTIVFPVASVIACPPGLALFASHFTPRAALSSGVVTPLYNPKDSLVCGCCVSRETFCETTGAVCHEGAAV